VAARRIRTKVLIDTFVQWLRLCPSGLITAVDAGLFQISPSRLRDGVFFEVQNFFWGSHSTRSVMKSCSSTAFEGIDGNEDAASRDLELVAAARASESGEPALTIDGRITTLNSEQVYDLRQRSHCALRAISKLNVRLRTPTETLIERECSMKEVACTLDLSLAAVKSRLYRAREQLPCSVAFKGRVPNVGSISGSKRQYVVPSLQNREVPCPSCD
jgi:hypothetical protein